MFADYTASSEYDEENSVDAPDFAGVEFDRLLGSNPLIRPDGTVNPAFSKGISWFANGIKVRYYYIPEYLVDEVIRVNALLYGTDTDFLKPYTGSATPSAVTVKWDASDENSLPDDMMVVPISRKYMLFMYGSTQGLDIILRPWKGREIYLEICKSMPLNPLILPDGSLNPAFKGEYGEIAHRVIGIGTVNVPGYYYYIPEEMEDMLHDIIVSNYGDMFPYLFDFPAGHPVRSSITIERPWADETAAPGSSFSYAAESGGDWVYTKYDELKRPIITGTIPAGNSFADYTQQCAEQTHLYEQRGDDLFGYTNQKFPEVLNSDNVLSVSYYDDYAWLEGADAARFAFKAAQALVADFNDRVVGQATGSKTKVLGPGVEPQWLTSVTYYDHKYRPIQIISELYPDGLEVVSNRYDFVGNVTASRVTQTVGTITHTFTRYNEYDNFGRLKKVGQTTGNATERTILAAYDYDDMGQLSVKKIHNQSESMTFAYNLTGKMTGFGSNFFSYRLGWNYSVTDPGSEPASYTGNIVDVVWTSLNPNHSGVVEHAYRYSYDPKGQLLSADYGEKTAGSAWDFSGGKWGEKDLSYDKQGNILSLTRTDSVGVVMHRFDYAYANSANGNALSSLDIYTGATAAPTALYEYDASGNMTYDAQQNNWMRYNLLGLPELVSNYAPDGETVADPKEIVYIYNSAGVKLAMTTGGSSTYYRGAMVWTDDSAGGEQLLHMLHPEGTVNFSAGSYDYRYFVTDHLGSTRVVLEADGADALTDVQYTDYYAFGLAWSVDDPDKNKYLFTGKELQDADVSSYDQLAIYDFGWRQYNAITARWSCPDRMAEKYYSWSPYNYCLNNPVMFIDPNGLEIFNDHDEELNDAQNALDEAKVALEAAAEKYGTDSKEYKAAERDVKRKERARNSIEDKKKEVDAFIREFKEFGGANYTAANELTYSYINKDGEVETKKLDIAVRIGNLSSSVDGHGENAFVVYENGEMSKMGMGRENSTVNVTIRSGANDDTLAHECGHAVTIADDPRAYRDRLDQLGGRLNCAEKPDKLLSTEALRFQAEFNQSKYGHR